MTARQCLAAIKARMREMQTLLRDRKLARDIRSLRYDSHMLDCQIRSDSNTLQHWRDRLRKLEMLQRLHQFEDASRITDRIAGRQAPQE